MDTTTQSQIAQALEVSPNQIKSIREMAWVFCVVIHGRRATFVSKKAVEKIVITKTQRLLSGDVLMLTNSSRVLIGRYCASSTDFDGGCAAKDVTAQAKGRTIGDMAYWSIDEFPANAVVALTQEIKEAILAW